MAHGVALDWVHGAVLAKLLGHSSMKLWLESSNFQVTPSYRFDTRRLFSGSFSKAHAVHMYWEEQSQWCSVLRACFVSRYDWCSSTWLTYLILASVLVHLLVGLLQLGPCEFVRNILEDQSLFRACNDFIDDSLRHNRNWHGLVTYKASRVRYRLRFFYRGFLNAWMNELVNMHSMNRQL